MIILIILITTIMDTTIPIFFRILVLRSIRLPMSLGTMVPSGLKAPATGSCRLVCSSSAWWEGRAPLSPTNMIFSTKWTLT